MLNFGWFAIPDSFKIYLKVDIDIAVQRAFNDSLRKDTEPYESIEDAKSKIMYRHTEETNRWIQEYGVNRDDMSNYDLVIDTSYLKPEEIADQIIEEYEKWLNK